MRIARFICSLLLAVGLLAIPVQSRAQVAVGISVQFGPPVLPVYVQPICPEPSFIWVPGYWAYGPDGYFWVPGTWVEPPEVGLLWTPGYWAWEDSLYLWYPGYWGPEVGYYGGINYGFGYTGVGFFGGYWRGGTYYYNRAVTNVNVTVVRNTYNTRVNNYTTINRASFNGGPGGISARPTSQEMNAARKHHVAMTSLQMQHQQSASTDRQFLASVNHGRPDVVATTRPGEFNVRGAARGRVANEELPSENRKGKNRPGNSPANIGRSEAERPPSTQPPRAGAVNPGLEQRQQREIEKMRQKQDAERQKVDRRQTQERQRLEQQRAEQSRQEQLQRRQQQQTQQIQQRHDQQAQRLQERQQKEVERQQRQGKDKKVPEGGRPPGH